MAKIIIKILFGLLCFQPVYAQQMFHAHNQTVNPDLLLDTYTGATLAFSLRKLDKDYTGYAIRISNAAHTSTLDIGFDVNGDLDVAAINTFRAGGTAEITRWYDQSGTGNFWSRTANSGCAIAEAAGVFMQNGKPTIKTLSFGMDAAFNGGTSYTYSSLFGVLKTDAYGLFSYFTASADGTHGAYNGDGTISYGSTDGTNSRYFSGSDLTQRLLYQNMQSSLLYSSLNGGTPASLGAYNSSMTVGFLMGRGIGTLQFKGQMQELIFFTNEQSANQAGIRANINSYYTIY